MTKNQNNVINLNGVWTESLSHVNKTSLNMSITTHDFGEFLTKWHMTDMVRNGSGVISYQGGWLGAPYDPDKKTLYGKVSVVAQNGLFVNLGDNVSSEMGIGKLLNIFSLQTLPRRLSLNFNDLTDKGFSFDQLGGHFDLKKWSSKVERLFCQWTSCKS